MKGDCFGESFQLVSKALMFQKWHNFYDDDDFCHPHYFDDKNAAIHGDNVWIMMTDWQSHDISIFQAHKGNVRKRATLQNAHFLLLWIFTFLLFHFPLHSKVIGKYTKLKGQRKYQVSQWNIWLLLLQSSWKSIQLKIFLNNFLDI